MVMVGLMMVNHDDGDGGHDDGNSNQGNAAREGFEQVFMKIRDAPKYQSCSQGGEVKLYYIFVIGCHCYTQFLRKSTSASTLEENPINVVSAVTLAPNRSSLGKV